MMNLILLQTSNESKSIELLYSMLDRLLAFGEKLIVAVIVYFIGRWIVNWLMRLVDRIMSRKKVDDTIVSFANNMIDVLLKVVLALIIINILGVETTSLAAVLAAAGLAVGMAMKDNLSNFAGGVMILLNKPFKLKDNITAQGVSGIVKDIGILYTVLLTADNRTIYLPNGPLSTGTIINVSTQKERRVDIILNISYGNDADSLKEILYSVVNTEEKILRARESFVGVTQVNNGSFDITVRVWALSENYSTVRVNLNELIYRTLTEKGIFASSTLAVKMVE